MLIANECVDTKIRGKVVDLMCKLELEKVNDNVNWDYLLSVLEQMWFRDKWFKWISFCIKTVRFSILVSGEPVGFFPSKRGHRQGDPLSPFLFILDMEGFTRKMIITIHNNFLKGFRIGEGGLEICHLLCVDDTIIFCEATVEQVTYVRVILVEFEVFFLPKDELE